MENTEENIRTNREPLEKLKRIDGQYISHEIRHLLHFEKGFFFTLKNLLLKPGKSIREFLFEDRVKYVKPIIFLIFTSIIFKIALQLLNYDYFLFNVDKIDFLQRQLSTKGIGGWTDSHIGYAHLIMGIFLAIWIKIFFKNHKYNIYEIFVLLCYVLGQALFILAIFIFLFRVLYFSPLTTFGTISYFIYIMWAIGQFFGEKKAVNYLKSFLAYCFGYATYLFALILISYLLKYF